MFRWIIFLLLAVWITGAQANDFADFDDEDEGSSEEVDRYLPQPMQAWLEALKEELDPKEVVELDLGTEKALALEQFAFVPHPKGQVILLPGANEHPNWPNNLAKLRLGLAEQGWHSLAISLPFYTGWKSPARQLGSEPLLALSALSKSSEPVATSSSNDEEDFADDMADDEEGADLAEDSEQDAAKLNQKEFTHLSEQLAQRLEAAMNYLPPAEQQVLVLQGESFYWLADRWLAEQLAVGGAGAKQPLVFLFTKQPVGAEKIELAEFIQGLGANQPILDIYLANNIEQKQLAKERKIAYLRAGNKLAVQLEAASAAEQDWLVKRVVGWLRRVEKLNN